MTNNNLGNYWTSSGPYGELLYYIRANVDDVKEDIGLLVSEIQVPANVQEYAATSMELLMTKMIRADGTNVKLRY